MGYEGPELTIKDAIREIEKSVIADRKNRSEIGFRGRIESLRTFYENEILLQTPFGLEYLESYLEGMRYRQSPAYRSAMETRDE